MRRRRVLSESSPKVAWIKDVRALDGEVSEYVMSQSVPQLIQLKKRKMMDRQAAHRAAAKDSRVDRRPRQSNADKPK